MAKTFILNDLAEKEKISISALNTKLGLSNGTLSSSIKRGAPISAFIEKKLLETYPNINPHWIETGTPPIFHEEEKTTHPNEPINIVTFLTRYREGIKAATGTTLSLKTLAQKLGHGITMENIVKWENHNNVPAKEEHRRALRDYFQIENLDVIPVSYLQHAISCWPHTITKPGNYSTTTPPLPEVHEDAHNYISGNPLSSIEPNEKDMNSTNIMGILASNARTQENTSYALRETAVAMRNNSEAGLILARMLEQNHAGQIPNAKAM